MHVHTHTDILTTDLSSIIYLHLCIGDFSYLSIPLWCESLFILAKENGKMVKMAIFGSPNGQNYFRNTNSKYTEQEWAKMAKCGQTFSRS